MDNNTDITEEERELLLLDKLLSEPFKNVKESDRVPKLVEDKSFADAFSYEVDPKLLNAATTNAVAGDEVDSSDDEEVKNFLERKFNEYGSGINKKLKQERNSRHEDRVEHEVNAALRQTAPRTNSATKSTFINKASTRVSHQPSISKSNNHLPTVVNAITPATPPPQPPATIYTDPIFGLRIINPLISSTSLVERMSGRKSVSFADVAFHIERGDLSKDWVIAGVVVTKSPVRQTKTGQPFSIWRLSDLRGEMKMISLFLFKGAHKELWKTAVGTSIAILNPGVLEKRAEAGDIACLSIDTPHKMLILGQSKDMGVCKARKKDGSPCTAVVNLRDCDYCIYHMKQEYNKMSRRSELQSETAGRGLNELRNKVLGKSEVFYGGQSFMAIPAKKSSKLINKDKARMNSLAERSRLTTLTAVAAKTTAGTEAKPLSYAQRDGPISHMANNIDASSKQRQKDLERLKILQNNFDKNSSDAGSSLKLSEIKTTPPSSSKVMTTSPISTSPAVPKPQIIVPEKFKNREFSQDARTLKSFSENISVEINIGQRQAQWRKSKAIDLLKQSPIQKANPNSLRGSQQCKRRAIDVLNDSTDCKRKKLDDEQRHEEERKSRIQRILDATSSHQNLIDMREQQEQDQYFNKLEKKEALEEKLLNTYKVPCKAVICSDCKYTAFSASERCRQEKHHLRVIDAEKRFFQCKDCGNRTATVFRLPKISCKNCSGSRWERAAVIRGKTVSDATQGLSIRGNEETFLGSLAGSANLNLLVPDDE